MSKRMMKKFRMNWYILVLVVIILGAGGYIYISNGKLHFQKAAVAMKEVKTKQGEQVVQVKDKGIKIIDNELPATMTEDEVMDAIHKMSHQKVLASQKWGSMPLTSERVNRLLEIVSKNKDKYSHSSVYEDILKRWAKGDFSRVDEDHNTIWNLQGGSVGKAYGIASPEQEKKFIEENFNIKE